RGMAVIEHARGERLAVRFPGRDRTWVFELGAEAPSWEDLPPRLPVQRPYMDCDGLCAVDCPDHAVHSARIAELRKTLAPEALVPTLRDEVREKPEAEAIGLALAAANDDSLGEVARELLTLAASRFPDDVRVRLAQAAHDVDTLNHASVVERLSGREPVGLSPDSMLRWWHILGISHLWRGETDAAREAWKKGAEIADEDPCGVRDCLELVADLDEPEPPELAGPSRIRAVRRAVRDADRCLEANDPVGAVA